MSHDDESKEQPMSQQGPLEGIRVIEIGGIGPAPHACMLLADLGADLIRVDRPGGNPLAGGPHDFLTRGRPSVALDLKHPEGRRAVLSLVAAADALVEGMRPGTMERLGLGPEECLAVNDSLVYGRMTGWGQSGPLAHTAGHDINYIATAGALHGSGQDPNRPHFASNLVGDFGGGSTYLVIGLLSALLHARSSGVGQVVDAAVLDGTAHLNAMAASYLADGTLVEQRAVNALDGGRPWYDVYATADGRHLAVGAIEAKFYAELMHRLGLANEAHLRDDPDRWPELRSAIADKIASRTMREWQKIFDDTDACVAPVLTMTEAARHPHVAARGVFDESDGTLQPAPAPRFSVTPTHRGSPPAASPGAHTREALNAWGVDAEALIAVGAAVQD